jgi:hypothetical protein
MNRVTPIAANRPRRPSSDQKGVHDTRRLPDSEFDAVWDSIILPPGLKDRVLAQAVLNSPLASAFSRFSFRCTASSSLWVPLAPERLRWPEDSLPGPRRHSMAR